MKIQLKIILVSFAVVLLLGVLGGAAGGSGKASDFFMIMGIISFFAGLVQLVAGLFLLVKTDKRYAQGFLMSGGILMLIGFTTCSANFTLNIH
jgi:ABC-type lipopolysaccharide export system ATPase subunit